MTDRPPVKQTLQGYLDGAKNGEIFGWARDGSNPERPVRITVHVDGVPVADTLAASHRPDVGARFGDRGLYGFTLDLARVAGPGGRHLVGVTLPDGREVDNGPLRVSIPSRSYTDDDYLLFMHIPKTAGTSLREAIARNYFRSEVAYLYPDPPGSPVNLPAFPLEQRRRLRCVIGHFKVGIHRWLPRHSRYVTCVRHPVARVISMYRHLSVAAPGEVSEDGAIVPIETVLQHKLSLQFDNVMVRYFAGLGPRVVPYGKVSRAHVELAVSNLSSRFSFVGHQEQSQAGFDRLASMFGWPPQALGRSLVGRGTEPQSDRAALQSLILETNQWDMQLYQEILRTFPLTNVDDGLR